MVTSKLTQIAWEKICRKPDIDLNDIWKQYREDSLFVEGLPKYKEVRQALINEQNGLCPNCRRPFNIVDYEHHLYWQIDHILPKVLFPRLMFDLKNLRLVCQGCNLRKGALFGRISAKRALDKLDQYRQKVRALRST